MHLIAFDLLLSYLQCHLSWCELILCSGTEGTAGRWTGPVQEDSGWRGHGYVEDQVYPAADWGNDFTLNEKTFPQTLKVLKMLLTHFKWSVGVLSQQLLSVSRYQPDVCAPFDFFPSLFLILPRQLKGDSWHQDEAGGSTLGAVVLSGPGEGAPEGGEEVCHIMQLWTIDHEHWRFLVSLRRTV